MDKLAFNMPHDQKRERKNSMVSGKNCENLMKISVNVSNVRRDLVNLIVEQNKCVK